MTSEQRDHLKKFMVRRKWAALEAQFSCTKFTMLKCIREQRRPQTLTPDQWEQVLVYRGEWYKADAEMRATA